MKFITFFFLLAIILIVNGLAANAGTVLNNGHGRRPLTDTIIKLDSLRDKKLLKGKQSGSITPLRNGKP
ncbi:hypothetical protein ACFJIV_09945 [Mucilaginibacter sp. UC70_90]